MIRKLLYAASIAVPILVLIVMVGFIGAAIYDEYARDDADAVYTEWDEAVQL